MKTAANNEKVYTFEDCADDNGAAVSKDSSRTRGRLKRQAVPREQTTAKGKSVCQMGFKCIRLVNGNLSQNI